ncbi:MAG: 4Fe-4S binding protein [Atribacterota bacterium]|jgi:2-oxoglutarate ferredoxin oxidoreductase subunit delta|nr:4Fe-4S binding protein [Atribacterota bacterium]MDY0382617.1 4Fe-4S binding protein [Atribacterota bacterium]
MDKKNNIKVYKNEKTTITVNENWCKSCGICIHFCPKKVLVSNEKGFPEAKNIDDCIHCNLCELRCPDFAINVKKNEIAVEHSVNQKGLED